MPDSPLAPLLADWRERPQRTWSVVITVMGDAIAPRGGVVWLGTLLALFGALGIDAGALRTAMSRLVSDGWLERRRVGRNSAYSLAERGRIVFAAAAGRIYAGEPPPWDGRFHMVLQPPDRASLEADGYGQPLPGLFVRPGAVEARAGGAAAGAVAFDAAMDASAARLLAARAWPLERLASSFARFTDTFAALPGWTDADPLSAAAARTLLIHDYRRIVLQAPALPASIVPAGWPADAARRLCADAYAAMLPASEAWLDQQDLPAPRGLHRRFA